jgi:Uma2 family endonuclease
METLVAKITSAEFRAIDFPEAEEREFIFELINGEIVARNYPTAMHQLTLGELHLIFTQHLRVNKLGKIIMAPFGIVLDDFNDVQPDLTVVLAANQHIIKQEGIYGVPDLVVEIISPSSIRTDRKTKFRLYEDMGIAEYWLVDTKNRSIEVYQLTETGYSMHALAAETGLVESLLLPGLTVDVEQVFGLRDSVFGELPQSPETNLSEAPRQL